MKIRLRPKVNIGVLVLIVLASLVVAGRAQADIAPPGRPPGADIAPGDESTQVRMLSEIVVLTILDVPASGMLGQAETHASFSMRNLGASDEHMEVRFPLSYWDYFSGDIREDYPEIEDFRVRVNDSVVETRRVEIVDEVFQAGELLPWAVFDVSFPAGEDVIVDVVYTTEAYGDDAFPAFRYILQTGAGWKGTIGSADIIVTLPYDISPQNVLLSGQTGYGESSAGAYMEGNGLSWHFEDFEPSHENDITLIIVNQKNWEKVLLERGNVSDDPDNGEAWGRLGLAYKNSIRFRRGLREDLGGEQLLELAMEAYGKAVDILPEDADWHAGFADLLWSSFYWGLQWNDRAAAQGVLLRLMEEIETALTLDAEHKLANLIAEEVYYASDYIEQSEDGSYIFLALTDIPTFPTWTAEALETAQPSEMPEASATSSPLPATDLPVSPAPAESEDSGGTSAPCLSGTMIFPLIGLFLWTRRRRQ